MVELPEVMPRKRDDALVADFETELVVLIAGQREAHLLDEGLSLVLDSCDGMTPTAAVIAEIADGTGSGAADVEVWLATSLDRLRALGAIA